VKNIAGMKKPFPFHVNEMLH